MAQVQALQEFRSRLVSLLSTDARVEAVLEAGSNAVGQADRYSDLDIVIVATDGGYGDLLIERVPLAQRFGNLIASFSGEHVGEPRLLICLFGVEQGDQLLHVDLKIVKRADLSQRVDDPRVLFDQSDACEGLMRETPAIWPERGAQWFEDRIWIWLHYAAARAGRGEYFEAIDSLAFIRGQVLAPMLARAAGRPQRGVRHIEQVPGAAEALEATLAGPRATEVRGALLAACKLYLALRRTSPPPEPRHEAEQRVSAYFLMVL